jgi:hypothetical protein
MATREENEDNAALVTTASSPSSKKKYYPFGTPDHGKVAFSNVAHLSPQNIQFVVNLTSNNNKNDSLTSLDRSFSRQSKKLTSSASLIPEAELSAIEGMPETEKGLAPCNRVDCKEVILSIIDNQNKNQIERDEIVQECEKMIQLHQQLEEEAALTEADNKRMITEGNILEIRMKSLHSRLMKSENAKSTLDHERDELNSKVPLRHSLSLTLSSPSSSSQIMMMELEKQRTTRRSAEIQAALSEIMWKGSTTLLNDQSAKTPLFIKPYNAESHHSADNPSPTSYRALVDDHLLDINERPKTVPLIPSELRLLKTMTLTGSLSVTDFGGGGMTSRDQQQQHLSLLKSQSLHRSLHRLHPTSPHGADSFSVSDLSTASHILKLRQHSPLVAKLQSRLSSTVPAASSASYSVMDSSFKGYTPSGGKRTLGSISSQRYQQALTEQTERDLMSTSSSLPGLDPVFYLERARTSWGRERKLGKVRLRNDPEGYRRKMLTSVGHPGVFGSQEDSKDEDLRFLKTL